MGVKPGVRGPVRDQPATPHASTFLPESKGAARRRIRSGEEAHGGLSGVTPTSWGLGRHSGQTPFRRPQAPEEAGAPPHPPGLGSEAGAVLEEDDSLGPLARRSLVTPNHVLGGLRFTSRGGLG